MDHGLLAGELAFSEERRIRISLGHSGQNLASYDFHFQLLNQNDATFFDAINILGLKRHY